MDRTFNERAYDEQLLLKALIFSLLVHLLMFGTWKMGKTEGWWKHVNFPAWMKFTPKLMKPLLIKKVAAAPLRPQPPPQLVFVDVDPAMAQAAPPKAPKFYSSQNTTAGNPHPKRSPVVEINGRQNKFVKTTENVRLKPQPLQPSPKAPEKVTQPETKPLPQKAYTPGDLAMAKPRPTPQEKEGQAVTDPGLVAEPKPVHIRPRTIAEAKAEHGMLGEKSRQDGGVDPYRMTSTLDAIKTSYGDYDRDFIEAVRAHWYQLLENITVNGAGKVVIEFRLLPDGRITNLKVIDSEVPDLLSLACQSAILDPAPFHPWPLEMRRDIPKDYRDVTFTFFYSTE